MTHSLVFIFPTGTFSPLPVLLYFTIHDNHSPISLNEIVWNEIRRFINWNKNSWMPECCPLDECRAIILIESSTLYVNIQSIPSDYPQSTSVHLNWSPWYGLRKRYLRISRKKVNDVQRTTVPFYLLFPNHSMLLISEAMTSDYSWCQITLFFFLQCLQDTSCFLKHVLLRSLAAKLYFAWTVLWTFQTSSPTWVSTFNAWLNQPHDEHHSVQQAQPGAACFTLENNWCPGREEHPPICLQWLLKHCCARSCLF